MYDERKPGIILLGYCMNMWRISKQDLKVDFVAAHRDGNTYVSLVWIGAVRLKTMDYCTVRVATMKPTDHCISMHNSVDAI